MEHWCLDEANLCGSGFFFIDITLVVEVFIALHDHIGRWAGLFQSVSLTHLTPSRQKIRQVQLITVMANSR